MNLSHRLRDLRRLNKEEESHALIVFFLKIPLMRMLLVINLPFLKKNALKDPCKNIKNLDKEYKDLQE